MCSFSPACQFSFSFGITPLTASLASARMTTCSFKWRVIGDRIDTSSRVMFQFSLLTTLVLVFLFVASVEKIINICFILVIIFVLIPLDVLSCVIWASWSPIRSLIGIKFSQEIHGTLVCWILVVIIGLISNPSGVVGVAFLLGVLIIFIFLLEILLIVLLFRQFSFLHVVVDLVFH